MPFKAGMLRYYITFTVKITSSCTGTLITPCHKANITHTSPTDPTVAIEIPLRVKQHLGLDGERSWIILDDFNDFIWPGWDLRPITGKPGRYDYGMLPPALFDRILTRVFALQREGRVFSASREEG